MYDPPHDDYGITTFAYKLGQEAAKDGLKIKDNPFKPSGHERDTTLSDMLNEVWEKGFDDYFNENEDKILELVYNDGYNSAKNNLNIEDNPIEINQCTKNKLKVYYTWKNGFNDFLKKDENV